jgi:murein DD-endopeptidase MepM/ murein hydrolase activator NlpD
MLVLLLLGLGFSGGPPYRYVDPYSNLCEGDTGVCRQRWGCCGSGNWVWPTDSRVLDVRGFSGSHPAIDIIVNNGDPVYAVDSGIVNWAGYSTWGYGNLIIVNHGYCQTYYAHLGEVYVSCGQYVSRGEVVATVDNRLGEQGASVNPHLHFEYRRGEYNYSPWSMLPSTQVAPTPTPAPNPSQGGRGVSVVIGGD